MKSLDYRMQQHEKIRLFNMIDKDRSGTISGPLLNPSKLNRLEREFCDYWVSVGGHVGRNPGHQGHQGHHSPVPAYGMGPPGGMPPPIGGYGMGPPGY